MAVSYVSANSEVTKGSLNAATAELDAILRIVFQGKSPLAYDTSAARAGTPAGFHDSDLFGKFFFFGDDAEWSVIPQIFGAVIPYDHSTYTTVAAGLTVDDYDATKHLAICTSASWPLVDSLGVHTVEHESETYYLAQAGGDVSRPIADRERFRRLPVAEIVCEGTTELEWDSDNFNRYHFLRFHNLSMVSMTLTLGASTITIPALGCQAVRRSYPAGSSWDSSYTYLWQWQSGDSAVYSADTANNVGGLKVYHDWLDWLQDAEATRGYSLRDPAEIWEPSTGSPFPAIESTRKLIEYIKHPGRLLAWKIDAEAATEFEELSPTFAELVAGTETLKLDIDSGTQTITLESSSADAYDAFGASSTLTPIHPVALPHEVASGTLPSATCPSQYDPTGVDPGYSAQYRGSRDYPDFITVESGELAENAHGNWFTSNWSGATVSSALASAENDKTPTFGTELTDDPVLELKHDGLRLWLVGTHEFDATSRGSPLGRFGDTAPVKFWWTADRDTVYQSFGVDLSDRDGWLHSTTTYGRHVVDFDGYIDELDDARQEGNPDVAGTYGIDGGLDWTETRTTHDEPTILRTEEPNQVNTGTLTLPVRPRVDVAERVEENREDLEWYTTNRTDLLANEPTVDDVSAVVFYPILWSHFNHVAMRLNGIKAISPFSFQDVEYWGDIADGTWPMEFSGSYPLQYFCAVASTASRADELGLTVQSITEASVTGYYVTIADVATKAAELDLAMDVEGLHGYRTRLEAVSETEADYWQYHHSNTESDYRSDYVPEDSIRAISRRTISLEGYSIYSPGINREPQEHIIDLQRTVDFPEVPTGWEVDIGSRLLCVPRAALGYVRDPLEEARELELVDPVEGAPFETLATEFEEIDVYDAPTGDPAYLLIGVTETAEEVLTFPATHATITAAMDSTGDDRSEWHVTYMRRILIIRA